MSLSLARRFPARVAIVMIAPVAAALIASSPAMGQGAGEQYAGDAEKATLTFEVDTEGEVPEGATFFGLYGPPASEFSSVQLVDPDGDGTYTAAAGGIGGTELDTGDYVVSLEKGTSGESGRTTIYGPHTITLDEDRTISTSYTFSGNGDESPDNPGSGDDQYDEKERCFLPEGCHTDGGGDQYDNPSNDEGGSTTGGDEGNGSGSPNLLPDTGGTALLPAVGIGALLIGGGLLARRILW